MIILSLKSGVFIGATLLIAIVTVGWILKPLGVNIFQQYQHLQGLQKEIDSLQTQGQALASAQKNAAKIEELGAISEMLLPTKTDTSNFAIQIEDIAQKNGLSMQSLNFTPTQTKKAAPEEETAAKSKTVAPSAPSQTAQSTQPGGVESLTFQLQVKGSSDGILGFIANLEQIQRASSLNNLGITAGTEQDNTTGTLAGKIYSKSKATSAASLENLKISSKTEEKLRSYQYFGTPVQPSTNGPGRSNPFNPY